MKIYRAQDGEWLRPVKYRGYKLSCCDCGLAHRVDFRVRGGRIEFRAYRDMRATGQLRRWMSSRPLAT